MVTLACVPDKTFLLMLIALVSSLALDGRLIPVWPIKASAIEKKFVRRFVDFAYYSSTGISPKA
jgi:hypothetical protein